MELKYSPGQTPLDPDERAGLKPKGIATQNTLNEWEQLNISKGRRWAQRQVKKDMLDDVFLRELHKRMFGDTWKWAGSYRNSDKNIGCDWRQVSVRVRDLLGNTTYQIEHAVMPPDELAIRFHHQLVAIHPFPNGNGRHARLMADLVLIKLGHPAFTWGSAESGALEAQSALRAEYLAALQAADKGDIAALLVFARK